MTGLTEHTEAIISLLKWIGGGFTFLIVSILTYQFNRISNVKKDVKEIEKNYLDRFEEVNVGIGELKTSIATVNQKLDDLIKYKIQ